MKKIIGEITLPIWVESESNGKIIVGFPDISQAFWRNKLLVRMKDKKG